MRVMMVAPPGAGKSTQGARIAAHFDLPLIATGKMLRDNVARRTDLGHATRRYLDRGELVPDEIMLGVLRHALTTAKASSGGYVLDGLPRTMDQAWACHKLGVELGMTAHVALHLKADDEVLVQRLLARADIERRSDDGEALIRRRLRLYHQVTHP